MKFNACLIRKRLKLYLRKGKIMQKKTVVDEVCAKNEVAKKVLLKVRRLAPKYANVIALTLKKYNVMGDKIERLYNNCCQKNIESFLMTVNRFLEGKYTETEIHKKIKEGSSFEY